MPKKISHRCDGRLVCAYGLIKFMFYFAYLMINQWLCVWQNNKTVANGFSHCMWWNSCETESQHQHSISDRVRVRVRVCVCKKWQTCPILFDWSSKKCHANNIINSHIQFRWFPITYALHQVATDASPSPSSSLLLLLSCPKQSW